MNKELFNLVCENVVNGEKESDGIGTLSEKSVHSVIKHYYCQDPEYHEVKIFNFVADIAKDKEIIEIQNGHFDKLRRKLKTYLPEYSVNIVLPVIETNYLHWINPDTGEISKPRRSPRKGKSYDIFPELYKIKNFLHEDNLNFTVILIAVEEYRYLDGWSQDKKRGATKCDAIPTELIEEVSINSLKDYENFIPEDLPDNFTSKVFAKSAKITLSLSQTTLNILFHMKVVDRIGKTGNSYIYKRLIN